MNPLVLAVLVFVLGFHESRSDSRHFPETTTDTATGNRIAWGNLPDFRHPYVFASYNGHHYPVYATREKGSSRQIFYYQPLLLIQPPVVHASEHPLRVNHKIKLPVLMWTAGYKQSVMEAIRSLDNVTSEANIRLLPVQLVKVEWEHAPFSEVQLLSRWTSYSGQPSKFTIWFTCENRSSCAVIADSWNNHMDELLEANGFRIMFSMTERKPVIDFTDRLKLIPAVPATSVPNVTCSAPSALGPTSHPTPTLQLGVYEPTVEKAQGSSRTRTELEVEQSLLERQQLSRNRSSPPPGNAGRLGTESNSGTRDMTGHTVAMLPGQRLPRGEAVFSPERSKMLIMQKDGNLVLYNAVDRRPLWATKTDGLPVAYCIMQHDGNLVLYDAEDRTMWASGTHGYSGAALTVYDRGAVEMHHNNQTIFRGCWAEPLIR